MIAESNSENWRELGEMFDGLRCERRAKKEDSRIEYARRQLAGLGYTATLDDYNRCLLFKLKNGVTARIWPYTGWWAGKGIGSGRGIKKLLTTLRMKEQNGRN